MVSVYNALNVANFIFGPNLSVENEGKSSKDCRDEWELKKDDGNTSNDIAASVDNIIATVQRKKPAKIKSTHNELDFPSAIFVIFYFFFLFLLIWISYTEFSFYFPVVFFCFFK